MVVATTQDTQMVITIIVIMIDSMETMEITEIITMEIIIVKGQTTMMLLNETIIIDHLITGPGNGLTLVKVSLQLNPTATIHQTYPPSTRPPQPQPTTATQLKQ